MYSKILLLILAGCAALILSASVLAQDHQSLKQYSYDSTVLLRTSPKGPSYSVHVLSFAEIPDTSEKGAGLFHQVYRFTILDKDKGDTVQVINDVSTLTVAAWTFDDAFQAGDFNFDGYLDFRYLLDQGATANPTYRFWLYEPTRGTFHINGRLEELIGPSFDFPSKKIITFEKCGGGCWTESTYAFSAETLVKTEYLSCEYAGERNGKSYSKYTLAKTVEGRLTVTRTSVISDEEFEAQRQTLWR
jgi:hypothetical protein